MAAKEARASSTVCTPSSVRSAPSSTTVTAWAVSVWISPMSDGDRRGGRLGLLGQLADLVGDDREPAALLAGAGGLDGRVQRQQVGLLGDAGDRLDDAADALGLLAEAADRDRRLLGGLADGAHGLGRAAHDLGAALGGLTGAGGHLRGLVGALRPTTSSRR